MSPRRCCTYCFYCDPNCSGSLGSKIEPSEHKPFILVHRLEEENANSQRKDKTLEQKEDRIRKLKSQLEEAIHQKNKLNHAIEQKDERLLSLESRCAFPPPPPPPPLHTHPYPPSVPRPRVC